MPDETVTAWTKFLGDVTECSAKLQTETRVLANEVVSLTADLDKRFPAPDGWKLEAARIDSLADLFSSRARLTLQDTLAAYAKLRVDERLQRAFQDFRTDMKDAARKLPARGEISAREFVRSLPEMVGSSWKVTLASSWKMALARLFDRTRTVPIRPSVLEDLGLEAWLESHAEGRIYLFHAKAALALLDPWQTLRYHAFQQIRGEPADDAMLDRARKLWKEQADGRARSADVAQEELAKSMARRPRLLTEAVVTGSSRSADTPRHRRRRQRYEAYWGRQRRAVRALVQIESNIIQLGQKATQLATEFVGSADKERDAVQDELLAVLSALRQWQPGQPNPIPPPKAQLTSAEERALRWGDALRGEVDALLPVKVESLEPRLPLPPWRAPWRDLAPRQMFLGTLNSSSETTTDAFRKREISHKGVIREIERAREVVTFGIETSETDSESGRQIAQESVANAISLLEHQGEAIGAETDSAEPGIVMATTSCFYQFHLAFEQGTLSLASHLAREGGYRAFKKATHVLTEWLQYAGRTLWSQMRRATEWLLVWIGWRAPLESGLSPVETWRYLGEDFAIDLKPRHLPLIYARLFQVEPVEDPRFLVGREIEMAALAEAKDDWEAGRLASVVVVGERGSGKTSLLNCGVVRVFSNDTVVRARFTERILTPAALRLFLANQLELGDEENFVERLNSARRVIVLEEIERTFLRVVGGTGALRELLRIVAATSGSNLWVLGMTSAAFRFLKASEGAGRFFSHRINASSVEPEQLQNAILQRHNLSGLRLEFIPPALGDGVQGWIRRKIGAGEGPEAAFFNRLYVHSGGVFRSAFGLWLKHIDRAEGGVVYMGSPENPDYEALIRGLEQNDLFTLQMIRQHGSLTVEEHAELFDSDLELSRARIVQLLGREIIEPEPAAPGYRIRPEAGALVRSALSGQNLI